MGHEKLVEALEAETTETAKNIIETATKRADDLIQNAAADAEKLKQHKLSAFALEIERENTAKRNGLVSSLKGNLNALKFSLMEQTFAEVFLELKNLPEEKYRAALTKLFDRLLHHIAVYETGTLYADSKTGEALKEYSVSKKVELQKTEPASDIHSGFLFVSKDEAIKAESSFGSVLETIKPKLLIELKELLFGEL